MFKRTLVFLLMAMATVCLAACGDQQAPPEQAQVFGEPASTIPWNTPQRWEGQAAGFNSMRGNEDGR